MSSSAIVSAKLTTLTLLCCRCRLRRRFVVVFAVAVLVVFIAVWRHRRHHHHRRPRSPCRRRPFVVLATFVIALAVVATTFLTIEVALVVDCCVPLPPEEDHRLPSPSGN